MPPGRGRDVLIRNVAALAFAALVLALDVWAVMPAPVLPLLPLAVAVPELAPFALALGALALAASQVARGRARSVAAALAAVAIVCSAVPLAQLPGAWRAADAEMAAAFPQLQAAPLHRDEPVRVRYDVPVRTRDGARLAYDVYEPAGAGTQRRPALITIYGGAWIFGDRRQTEDLDRAFARRGIVTFAIDYRHAPRFRYPTQIDDVRDALATIARDASHLRIDPARVALAGRSAGGELALLAAYEPGPLRVRAVVAFYAPTDLTRGYARPPRPDPADVRRILRTYLGDVPERRAAAYAAASPLRHVRPGLPPTLLLGGGHDELVELPFQRALRDALRRDGDRVASIELPWSNHAFDAIPLGQGGRLARFEMERFLDLELGPL